MKILIVSGFLGAGKTTFIQEMAKATGRDFVIYENEYAGVGIDTQRLSADDSLRIWESTENCVCCSGKADFATSVLTISNSLDPEFLVVEPTGLAKLGNLLDNISKILYGNMAVLKPVTLVDVHGFLIHRQKHPDIYLNQIRAAATIVITKTEQAMPEEVSALAHELRTLNPQAEIITTPYVQLGEAWFRSLLTQTSDGTSVSADESGNVDIKMEQMAISGVSMPTPTHLIAFMTRMSTGEFGELNRAKGSLPCGNQWIKFDYVDGQWSITGDEPQEKSQCAFIGSSIRRNAIRELLQEKIYCNPKAIQMTYRRKSRKPQIRMQGSL